MRGSGVMPRERIWTDNQDFVPQIGWSDENVQIGITTFNNTPLKDYLGDFTGIWSTLDRADINNLIGLLRKARDSAYGVDE
jgi:hypothetical protein